MGKFFYVVILKRPAHINFSLTQSCELLYNPHSILSTVFRAQDKETGETVAIKQLNNFSFLKGVSFNLSFDSFHLKNESLSASP